MKALTDYERDGLEAALNLADGHAYQGIQEIYPGLLHELGELWAECEFTPIPVAERRFRDVFALLAKSGGMTQVEHFHVCPTASNSVDLVGALAADLGLVVGLVEPTFDNLALLLRRRHVDLRPIDEAALVDSVEGGTFGQFVQASGCDAIFLVQPNNPTGQRFDEVAFRAIAASCAANGTTLFLDRTFRFFDRDGFDDYAVLREEGTSFVSLEDTGKVWPTHDLKASLVFSSDDLAPRVRELYNEVYLCHSRFALAILERCLAETSRRGLYDTIWRPVDERRELLRNALAGTALEPCSTMYADDLSVEWLSCAATGRTDIEIVDILARHGVQVLPGRHFFWSSADRRERHNNVRLSLLKPLDPFQRAMSVLSSMRLHAPQVELV